MHPNSRGEKHNTLHPDCAYHSDGYRQNVQRRSTTAQKAVLFTVACLLSIAAFQPWIVASIFSSRTPTSRTVQTSSSVEEKNDPDFQWQHITPSAELVYRSCFDGYQCARLEVPMDWQRPDGRGNKVTIAVIRLPAKVPVTDPRYGGPVLTNPGGPGGSGVSQVLLFGRATQSIVDSGLDPNSTESDLTHKYHDIISFDPRGIGRTTPGIQCFPDSLSREAWALQNEALGLLGSSEDSFLRNWYRSRALAEGCSTANAASSDGAEAIGEHVNTSPVARDMLEIVERHAQWVAKQGEIAQITHDMTSGYDKTQDIARRTRWVEGETKIKYWGNSYGTMATIRADFPLLPETANGKLLCLIRISLGQTFASMFPDRIERLILDGVCDSHDYFFGGWFSNLQDSDKILDKFFEYCSDVGPADCSFYAPGGPETIRDKYEALLQDIFAHPRSVPGSSIRGPDVITWSDVKSAVRLGMYQPLIYMPMVADLLTDVYTGNGSLFANMKHMEHTPSCPTMECQAAGPYSQECNAAGDNGDDASMAILCTDGEGLGEVDEGQFQQYWHTLQNQSHVLGDWWAHTRLSCVGWKARAKWRFTGPFSANTSHPMLIIGNTLDPVTPLDNARRMAANFPGSVLLQQDCEGHTSWASPSICTAKAARTYFQTGVMPDPGTVCKVQRHAFENYVPSVAALDADDQILIDALEKIQGSFMDLKLRARPFAF